MQEFSTLFSSGMETRMNCVAFYGFLPFLKPWPTTKTWKFFWEFLYLKFEFEVYWISLVSRLSAPILQRLRLRSVKTDGFWSWSCSLSLVIPANSSIQEHIRDSWSCQKILAKGEVRSDKVKEKAKRRRENAMTEVRATLEYFPNTQKRKKSRNLGIWQKLKDKEQFLSKSRRRV